ncbi:MAG TPA: lipopolysaccharide heptosyltransferase II [Chitinophagaceae bacterium]|nr:lipopolysaccharide heptosyltransferase II [Chitinophagaceae bacterium]
MKILVRLPNWLGDMVMSVAFIYELQRQYPGAMISVIAKKGIHELLPFFPPTEHQFIFSKEEAKGVMGLIQFGRMIRKKEKFDLFFCLPDSFSSALMGWATGANKRIGFRKEFRGLFMTHTYERPGGQHRVEEYLALIRLFTKINWSEPKVLLQHSVEKRNIIVVNINSEASSRRLTISKATDILNALRSTSDLPIMLIGAPKEKAFVAEVFDKLDRKDNIHNLAGTTRLNALVELLAAAAIMLTTDSGPAHVANALGTPTIVLFGAGNENNTAPYNKNKKIMRLNKLSCEPCLKNECKLYKVPQCLQQLDVKLISSGVNNYL